MSKEFYTRENLIDHLERLAYYGSARPSASAIWKTVPITRRQNQLGDVPLRCGRKSSQCGVVSHGGHGNSLARIRAKAIPPESTCRIRQHGRGGSSGRSGLYSHATGIHQDWVDNRGGTKQTLTRFFIEPLSRRRTSTMSPSRPQRHIGGCQETHASGCRGMAARPVRGGETVDDELIAIVKQRSPRTIARTSG